MMRGQISFCLAIAGETSLCQIVRIPLVVSFFSKVRCGKGQNVPPPLRKLMLAPPTSLAALPSAWPTCWFETCLSARLAFTHPFSRVGSPLPTVELSRRPAAP